MPRPTAVQARPRYHLWLRYDDGIEGEVDLTGLVGRGVFRAWQDITFFESVRIAPHGALVWGEAIDLCPDALYLSLSGKSPQELFPTLDKTEVDA